MTTTHRLTLTFALLLPLVLAGCGIGGMDEQATRVPDGGSGSYEAMSSGERNWAFEVLDLVNLERAAAGLPALHWHEDAATVAYAHSFDMDEREFFGHTNPDGLGPGGRMMAEGVEFATCGENIAMGFASPRDVVEGWMGSDGHRKSIMSPEFTHLGIGIHTAEDGGPWWTQDFLR